jgi:hypothetical protein
LRSAPSLFCSGAGLPCWIALAGLGGAAPPARAQEEPSEHRVEAIHAVGAGGVLVAGEEVTAAGVVRTWAQRSMDGGRTWSAALTPAVSQHTLVSLVAEPSGELRGLTQWGVEGPGDVYLMASDDAGASWRRRSVVPRPSPFAEATGQRWSSWSEGGVTFQWDDEERGCLQAEWTTADGGATWAAPAAPAACGPAASPRCEATVGAATFLLPRCGEAIERQPLRVSRGASRGDLAVTPVDAGDVYAVLRPDAVVREIATGTELKLLSPQLARVEREPDGGWIAHLGAAGDVPDCSGSWTGLTSTLTVRVAPGGLLPVVTDRARLTYPDGSAVTLEAGAILALSKTTGEAVFRFAEGPPALPGWELPLPSRSVQVSDRFTWPGLGEDATPWPSDAEERVVRSWGQATVFGQRVGADAKGEFDGFGVVGAWDMAYVHGGRAWVVDGCATVEVALGEGWDGDGSVALGALGMGLGDARTLPVGTPLRATDGAWVGTTTRSITEPWSGGGLGGLGMGGAAGLGGARGIGGLGGGGARAAPEVRVLPDGRRCGPLLPWVARADGAPWDVCWTPDAP